MVKILQHLKILKMWYLRHAEHHAKNRTSLRGLDQETLFFDWPLILIKVDHNLAVLKAFLNRRDTKINISCRTMLQMELNHRRKDARVTDHLFCLSRNWQRMQSLSMALSPRRDRIWVLKKGKMKKKKKKKTIKRP